MASLKKKERLPTRIHAKYTLGYFTISAITLKKFIQSINYTTLYIWWRSFF